MLARMGRQESNLKALIWVIGEAHGIVAKTADALLNDGGESMRKISLKKEAASCRRMARDFAGRPEEPFLLRVANAMEELALVQAGVRPD